MAITKSAKKALKQNITRRQRNHQRKTKLKNVIKEFRSLVADKKFTEAKKLLPQAYKILDKTAKTGTIKDNTASRKKSRLTIMLNKAVKSVG